MAIAEGEEAVAPTPAADAKVVANEDAMAGENGGSPGSSLAEVSMPSFKEESYFVADLKEFEKQALQELKVKIQEVIQGNAFLPNDAQPEKVAELVAEAVSQEKVAVEAPLVTVVDAVAESADTLEAAAFAEQTTVAEASTQTDATQSTTDTEKSTVEESVVVETPAETEQTQAAAKEPELTAAPALSDTAVATKGGSVAAEEAPASATATAQVVIDEDISLWGVPLMPSKGDPSTDVILLKFLRARESKANNAFDMLKNTILWRKKYRTDAIVEEDLGTDFDRVAYLHGVDREGHPVSYNNFGALNDKDLYQKAFGDQAKTEKFLRWRVQLLEKSIKLLNFTPGGANAVIQVIDLKNSPWPAKKELRAFINQALNLLQDNYPELVVKNVLINVPWYFSALYSIISPFLTQRTKSKFVLVRGAKVTEALLKLISAQQLPVHYGGLSRVNDEDFEGVEAPVTELVVKAGEKQAIELEVPEAGKTVLWDLTVVGWDVSYGAEFIPSTQGGYTTVVEKSKKIISQQEPLRTAFKASEAGKVVLTIDNSASRKKKTAVFRHMVKRPES